MVDLSIVMLNYQRVLHNMGGVRTSNLLTGLPMFAGDGADAGEFFIKISVFSFAEYWLGSPDVPNLVMTNTAMEAMAHRHR